MNTEPTYPILGGDYDLFLQACDAAGEAMRHQPDDPQNFAKEFHERFSRLLYDPDWLNAKTGILRRRSENFAMILQLLGQRLGTNLLRTSNK